MARTRTYELAAQLYVYRWKRPLDAPRKGQLCRVLARGKMNSCLVEFVDGFQMLTSRNALARYHGEGA